jgi:phosphoserine aminotransferase
VLEEARQEMLDCNGSGMSVMEMSHRSPEYDAIHREALDLTRRVAAVPDDFDILFIQGGATLQFGMVPQNLLVDGARAGYVLSGSWGRRAYDDAVIVGDAYPAWDGGPSYRSMPGPGEIEVDGGTRYVHVTTNETIGGIRMVDFPDLGVPLVADMSSEYLARPIDWRLYDLVYGGVQKNLAPAGMAVVFLRRSILADLREDLPAYLRYGWHAESDSLGNTPPMFPIYLMGKILARIEDMGGVEALERASADKAAKVYAVIDESDGFYTNPVEPRHRSHMNVVFRLPSEELEMAFLAEAKKRRMVGLKGHRSVGGMRASLYAALPVESVDALVEFMESFADGSR